MKATEEIIKNINIDKYLEWVRDIYKELGLSKFIEVHEKIINEKKLQEFRITNYYKFKWMKLEQEGKLTKNQIIDKEDKLKTAFDNRKTMRFKKEIVKKMENSLSYIFFFISPGKLTSKNNKPLQIRELTKFIDIDIQVIEYYDKYINDSYFEILQGIEDKQEIYEGIKQYKINQYFDKEYFILDYIVNKTFSPIYGDGKEVTFIGENVNLLDEIVELKVLQSMLSQKAVDNKKKFSIAAKIELLDQLGFFKLLYFETPCPVGKKYEITSILLDADYDNIRHTISGLTIDNPPVGRNPRKYKKVINQLLNYVT